MGQLTVSDPSVGAVGTHAHGSLLGRVAVARALGRAATHHLERGGQQLVDVRVLFASGLNINHCIIVGQQACRPVDGPLSTEPH